MPDINASLGEEDTLKVGVGINTGMAWTATVGSDDCKDYTVMGDVANISSRLQNLAAPGEILVSKEVYDVVGNGYPNAEGRELELKGISEPVRAFSLT